MGVGRLACFAALLAITSTLLPSSARAERTQVDWQRGLLVARGIAVGDLRSPSRQLARVKAERQAKAQCRALLLKAVGAVRWVQEDKRPKAERTATLDPSIFALQTDYGTDGSVVVKMALPLDAMRALVYGPDSIEASSLEGPAALIIDARALGVKPALGFQLSDGGAEYRGPTLFFTSEKEARARSGIGKDAPLLVAKSGASDRGTILLKAGALDSVLAARPLVAILWKSGK